MPTAQGKVDKGKVAVGDFTLDADIIGALSVIGATANAVKLHDTRVAFKYIDKATGKPATFTVQLTVSRDPLDDTESLKVATAKAEQKQRKADKKAEETADRQASIKMAQESAQAGMLQTFMNVGAIAEAARVLVQPQGKK